MTYPPVLPPEECDHVTQGPGEPCEKCSLSWDEIFPSPVPDHEPMFVTWRGRSVCEECGVEQSHHAV